MHRRKNPAPKRLLLLTHAPLPKKKTMRKLTSKFFFDMLCCLDVDVVAKYIVPHLIPVSSSSKEQDWSIIALLYNCNAAGLLKRDPMKEVFFPAFSCIQGMEIRTSIIFKMFGVEMFKKAMLDLHEKARVGLVFDIIQCPGCMFTYNSCKCMKKKDNSTCMFYLKTLHHTVLSREDPLPIKSLFIHGLDSSTSNGMDMIQLVMEIVMHSLRNNPYVRASVGEMDLVQNAPKTICYDNICMRRCSVGPFESLFQVCDPSSSSCSIDSVYPDLFQKLTLPVVVCVSNRFHISRSAPKIANR
jgi:hypothetical protein